MQYKGAHNMWSLLKYLHSKSLQKYNLWKANGWIEGVQNKRLKCFSRKAYYTVKFYRTSMYQDYKRLQSFGNAIIVTHLLKRLEMNARTSKECKDFKRIERLQTNANKGVSSWRVWILAPRGSHFFFIHSFFFMASKTIDQHVQMIQIYH